MTCRERPQCQLLEEEHLEEERRRCDERHSRVREDVLRARELERGLDLTPAANYGIEEVGGGAESGGDDGVGGGRPGGLEVRELRRREWGATDWGRGVEEVVEIDRSDIWKRYGEICDRPEGHNVLVRASRELVSNIATKPLTPHAQWRWKIERRSADEHEPL